MYKLLKKPFFGTYMVKWKNPLTGKNRNDWQPYVVESRSKAKIAGLYAKGKNEIKGTIVLGHPLGKAAKAYFLKSDYPDMLRENGYNVFVFDFNGFGESSMGTFSYFQDVIAVGKKAKEIAPDYPVGYHGISFGASWAIIAFTEENHPYHFAVIESASTTLDEFWINYPLAYKVLKILYFFLPKYKKKINMLGRFHEIKNLKSMLLIYPEKDDITPLSMAKRLMKKSVIPIELYTVSDVKHAKIIGSKQKKAYYEKIIKYFDSQVK